MIPPLGSNGLLPAGGQRASWREFAARFATTPRRRQLLAGLHAAVASLRKAGCREVYINGSFVTKKHHPADYDGCWSVVEVDPNLLDPVLLLFDHGRAAQKAKFGGELFPAELPEGASGLRFVDFFQRAKVGERGSSNWP